MAKIAQMPTEQEVRLITNYIVLPYVLNVFERDKNKIEKEQVFKTFTPYVAMLDLVIGKIMKDLSDVRKELRKRGIKVYDGERTSSDVTYEYLCRGYMNKMTLLWGTLRADVEIMMNHYLGVYETELIKAGCL
ncbi:hypothetical protein [Paenibacillus sp. GYB003]|uniref:hypothetical protein n=1 Tax=Paenibacillus sp. GYB003 TaxID=2994392 RepID=UPI002F96C195